MLSLWWCVALFAVLLGYALWTLRARRVLGVQMQKGKWELFLGTTRDLFKEVLQDGRTTVPEHYTAELRRHGWQPFAWGRVGGEQGVVICHPDDVKCVLKDEFNSFVKAPKFTEVFGELLGKGIFNVNGPEWKEQRVVASHMFNRRQLRERMSAVFGSHAQEMVQLLRCRAEEGGVVNVQPFFYHYTFDCINGIAFNRNVNSLKGNEKDVRFQEAFDRTQSALMNRFIVPWWKLQRFLQSSKEERTITASLKVINEYILEVVSEYVDENGTARDGLEEDQTLTGLFLRHAVEEGRAYSATFLRDMILNFVIAGRDTTASALTSCAQYLTAHPEWQDKLHAEAMEAFGGNLQEPLSFDDIEGKAPLSEAVFMEALRLRPSVPANEKMAVRCVRLPSGVVIEPGTFVDWIVMATNRHPEVWGDDADEFKPDRWLGGGKNPTDFEFPTFNAAYRLCLGKNMAILEGQTALLTLLAHFKFHAEGETPKAQSSVTWQLPHLMVRVEPRQV